MTSREIKTLRRLRRKILTFGGMRNTDDVEFWVSRDEVISAIDEAIDRIGDEEAGPLTVRFEKWHA